jgi:hypothetical protein
LVILGILTLPLSLVVLSWLVRAFGQRLLKTQLSWRSVIMHSAIVWLLSALAAFGLRFAGPAGIFGFIAAWFLVHAGSAVTLFQHTLDADGKQIGAVHAAKVGVLAAACLFALGAMMAWFASLITVSQQ